MSDPVRAIYKIWEKERSNFSPESLSFPAEKVKTFLASIFCPGPFYYYVMDFQRFTFEYVHPTIEDLLGIKPSELSVEHLPQYVHPEDVQHFVACEERATAFLFREIDPVDIPFYKVSYCFRLRQRDGAYRLFMHQALAISVDEQNRIAKSLTIHSDISHITTENNRKVSFLGLNGLPSYTGVDPYREEDSIPKASFPRLTEREMEVVRLLAEGFTAEEVAKSLFISFNTVRTHRKNLLKKLQCKTTGQLVGRCIRAGLI